MHPDLVRLHAADGFDRELLALKNQKRKLEQALEDAQTGAKTADETLARLTAEDTANTARQHELQRTIEKYEARRKSAERVLEGGGGDPEAAERQIIGCSEQLDKFETELLECMETADALLDSLAAARSAVEESHAVLAERTAGFELAVAALRAEFDSIVPKRDAELAALDSTIRHKYLGVRDRKGFAVTFVEKGACHACRMFLQQQHIADLKRGLLLPCRGCGRWLVPDEPG